MLLLVDQSFYSLLVMVLQRGYIAIVVWPNATFSPWLPES